MIKFKNGDQVIKIENNKIRKGVIRRMFFEVEPVIALVEFDEGTCEKVYITDLALNPETPETEPVAEATEETTEKEETEPTPTMRSEITITPEEFKNLTVEVAYNLAEGDFSLALAFGLFAAEIAKALFKVESENE